MTSRSELEQLVAGRAQNSCEYCRMHQALQGARFHLEHINPRSRGGQTELDNLALACPGCNLHKSDRIEAADLETGIAVPLFHPRLHAWREHFAWDDYHIVGLTPIGRATVAALGFNEPRKIRIRQAEQTFGLFPPET
ncbi:MAG: HNH endonuclease signature motif containing protein [Bythopirellula sp.]|nr:HNH endonuclease signature motif containing protein [Bythopirellula sp.]